MYILATDYDGTLNRGGVSQTDRDAIAAFRKSGNRFGVVTGRDCGMYDTLCHEGVEFDFVIVMNGAMALDSDGSTVFEEVGDAACVRGITELIGGYDNFLSCVYRRTRKTFHSAYPEGNDRYRPLCEIEGLTSFTMMNTWVASDELASRAVAEINERYGRYVHALQNGNCIDIPPCGIDKGVGIARYADMLGVPHENIWCAGDNLNDMAMISRFHGCAVVNAREEVKAAAEAVRDSIADVIAHIGSAVG